MKAVVGIDLGTSNCAWATVEARAGASLTQLAIGQWVEGRRRGSNLLLPSALYAPRPSELFEGSTAQWIAGRYAQERAQETIGRGIVSAKSWLCHAGVDRLKGILPAAEQAADGTVRISPVTASQILLEHLRDEFSKTYPQYALKDTRIVLTVPASFDPTARQLTAQAAHNAGLNVSLLEEPQAAFYDYLDRQPARVEALLEGRQQATVLVCDMGGGTLDLSLIDLSRREGKVLASRRAVGRHLLLGGDNMDLAIAHWLAPRISQCRLSPRRMGQLVAECRRAKEVLLGAGAPDTVPVRLLSEGAALAGSSLSTELCRSDVEELILDGFFPLVEASGVVSTRRSGFVSAGLPYEREPAVTRHIAAFLELHEKGESPSALLLNGGMASSPVIVSRLLEFFRRRSGEPMELLGGAHGQLAVSRGAALHGLSLLGLGRKIEGGAGRGLYMGLGSSRGSQGRRAVCVIPRGAREDVRHVARGALFELVVGQRARFELYATSVASHQPGDVVGIEEEKLAPLPALTTTIESSTEVVASTLKVELEGELTSVGTLELYCAVAGGGAEAAIRHLLEFELSPKANRFPTLELSPEVLLILRRVYGKGTSGVESREVKDVIRNLEKHLGLRKTWSAPCARALCDRLLELRKARLRSEDHERVFWMLVSYCLRPGYGAAGDPARLRTLWPLFLDGVKYRKIEKNWQQFWIAWRRLVGGLNSECQASIWDWVSPFLAPSELKWKKLKGLKPLALDEMLSMVCQLERTSPQRRAQLGGWLVERTWTARDPRLWQYLSWVGARVPAYGDPEQCVDRKTVSRWLDQLLMERWRDVPTAIDCALSLARVTGDQNRDLSESQRLTVADALKAANVQPATVLAVQQLVPLSAAARSEQRGESLPLGLTLIEPVGSADPL